MYQLKQANINDIDNVMMVINSAKKYLKNQGLQQWNLDDGYPSKETLKNDILNKTCYILINNDDVIGTMSILLTPDENYEEIYDGKWLTNNKYASIHRIAVREDFHNQSIGKVMLELAEEIVIYNNIKSIRIDTHKNNIPMQKTLIKSSYTKCGFIILKRTQTDNLRDAFEKVL